MPQDEVYDALNSQYRYWASGDIYDDAREKYVRDSTMLGREYKPMQHYLDNETDAKLRNHFIVGTPEYIESKRYYPDKEQLRKDDAFLVPYIDNIREYLITGERPANVLPGVDITPEEYREGGSIDIKHPGRLTELKKRTGKTEAELWATGNLDYVPKHFSSTRDAAFRSWLGFPERTNALSPYRQITQQEESAAKAAGLWKYDKPGRFG